MEHTRHIVGCMTGTSLDALDVALVRIQGHHLQITAAPLAFHSLPLGDITNTLRIASQNESLTTSELTHARDALGTLHAKAISHILTDQPPPSLVAAHGQTIFHQPPHSLQLLNPWPIAAAAHCPVVYDLRGADLILQGQGAPITPIADWILFRSNTTARAIVNLGGFCNITLLPIASDISTIQGYDLCACNHILNTITQTLTNQPFDRDGILAQQGTPDPTLSQQLSNLLRKQHTHNRSLGTGDECLDWINTNTATHSAPDLLATACDALAHTIALATSDADEIFLAGGSTLNLALVSALQQHCSAPVQSLTALGIEPQQREAIAIAILGALLQDAVPITLPTITGRSESPLLHACWANIQPPSDTLQ